MQGLFGKYLISKADGSLLDPEAKYFILRYDNAAENAEINKKVLLYYCDCIKYINPYLYEDLKKDIHNQ